MAFPHPSDKAIGEFNRDLARRRIALLLSKRGTKADDDDWNYNYPQLVVSWLLNLMEAYEHRYSPLVILEVEDKYPGLWDDLLTEQWYRSLMDEQKKGS
jgi:hypothetical protein